MNKNSIIKTKSQHRNSFSKEWVELTLCNMIDEIMQLLKKNGNNEKAMQLIKEYSAQIYHSQNNYDDKKQA